MEFSNIVTNTRRRRNIPKSMCSYRKSLTPILTLTLGTKGISEQDDRSWIGFHRFFIVKDDKISDRKRVESLSLEAA